MEAADEAWQHLTSQEPGTKRVPGRGDVCTVEQCLCCRSCALHDSCFCSTAARRVFFQRRVADMLPRRITDGWQRPFCSVSLSLSFLLPVRPSVCLSGCLSSMFQSSSPQVHGGCDEHARLVMVQGLMKCEGHIEVASHEVDILKIHVLEVCDPKPLHEVMHCRMLSMEQVRD